MDRIAARNNPAYFVIRDAFNRQSRIVVLCRPPASLLPEQMVDVAGVMATLPSGERCIVEPTVYARIDEHDKACDWNPLYWLMPEPEKEVLSIPTSPIPPSDPSLDNDGMGLPGPVTSIPADTAWRGTSVRDLLSNPPLLFSSVTLECKPIVNAGEGWILVGDDDSDAAVKVYTSISAKRGDRVIALSGAAHSENGRLVLYADSGLDPYFDPQNSRGSVHVATNGAIAWIKTLGTPLGSDIRSLPQKNAGRSVMSFEEGAVELSGMVVTAVFHEPSSSDIDFFYVQNLGCPSGIKVEPPTGASVEVGDVVGITGTVYAGTVTGECYIDADSVHKDDIATLPKTMGMPNRSTAGAGFGAQPALYMTPSLVGAGLNSVGTRVKVWGKRGYASTSNGQTVYFLDDGSGLVRSDHDGLKAVYHRSQDAPAAAEGDMIAVTGVLGAEMDDGNPVPVVRVANRRVIHVSPSGNNNNDGCRWDTAKYTVGAAITAAAATTPKCEVWVAAGTYYEHITLVNGVAVYGGFAGTETAREQRNWTTHETILDGSNTGSVVTAGSGVTASACIDGFTIQHGSYAGIACEDSSPTIANNVIRNNGWCGVDCYECASRIVNNVITGNGWRGVHIYNLGCRIINNTIVDNGGDGINVWGSDNDLVIANCIIASHASGTGIYSYGDVILSSNDLYGNYADYEGVSPGPTDIYDNPLLSQDNRHIDTSSPCRDAGENSAVQAGDVDIDGKYRISDGVVDIGADEVGEGFNAKLRAVPHSVPIGQSSTLTATIRRGFEGLPNQTVTFTVPQQPASSNVTVDPEEATTGMGGTACTELTCDTVGWVTAQADATVNGNPVSATVQVQFYDPQAPDDWPMFQHDIAHTGVTTTSLGSNLSLKWNKTLAGNSGGTLWSSPVVANGVVYVATNNAQGTLYAFDASTGDPMSTPSINLGSPVNGTPCVADGRVYVGTYDGVLHVLDATDLSVEWTKAFPGESITGGVIVWNGAVYVGTNVGSHSNYGRLHTIDIASHDERSNSPAVTRYGVDYTTPAIDAGLASGARCYVSDFSCYITAAQCSDGLYKWKWSRDPDAFFSSPTIYDGYIFVGSHVNGMYRIVDDGIFYREPTPYYSSQAGSVVNSTAAAWNGKLYFGTNTGNVCRIDTSTFTTADWITNLGAGSITSSPLISAPTGLLFDSTDRGYVFALNTSNGVEVWHYDLTNAQQGNWPTAQVLSSPAAAGGNLYIVAGDGTQRRLYCFGP